MGFSAFVDKDHIHNHIVINSVSMETGMKWRGNGDTLKANFICFSII